MRREDFAIGQTFYTATGRWRCTDVGTRVVVAIKYDAITVTQSTLAATGRRETREVALTFEEAEQAGWFRGPPYAGAESVFDEYDMEGCAPSRQAWRATFGEDPTP